MGRLLSLVLTKVADSTTSQLVSDWIVGQALDGIIVPATIKSSISLLQNKFYWHGPKNTPTPPTHTEKKNRKKEEDILVHTHYDYRHTWTHPHTHTYMCAHTHTHTHTPTPTHTHTHTLTCSFSVQLCLATHCHKTISLQLTCISKFPQVYLSRWWHSCQLNLRQTVSHLWHMPHRKLSPCGPSRAGPLCRHWHHTPAPCFLLQRSAGCHQAWNTCPKHCWGKKEWSSGLCTCPALCSVCAETTKSKHNNHVWLYYKRFTCMYWCTMWSSCGGEYN